MNTKIFKISDTNDTEQINQVADILNNGGIVAIPTETVYGLAANALNGEAVAKIFKAKGRPQDNPLIVHIAKTDDIIPLVKEFPESAQKLADKFWPGPLTMILPKSKIIPDEVSAGQKTVAVRMPSHPIARAIIEAAKVPLAAPSANISGSPSPTCAQHVINDLNGKVDAIVDGGECLVGVESTVITLATNPPRLLRPGGIIIKQLRDVLGEVIIDDAVLNIMEDADAAPSPGMKYKHYSPNANVIILRGSLENYIDFIKNQKGSDIVALCFDEELEMMPIKALSYGKENDSASQAHNLFDALRELDNINAKTVYVRCPNTNGVGLAVFNRLLRAAEFEVIDL